jgi:hypothetical protein
VLTTTGQRVPIVKANVHVGQVRGEAGSFSAQPAPVATMISESHPAAWAEHLQQLPASSSMPQGQLQDTCTQELTVTLRPVCTGWWPTLCAALLGT